METFASSPSDTLVSACSYPTYEEWKLASFFYFQREGLVLILPMRNGNSAGSLVLSILINSSYPTYEEWKQIKEGKECLRRCNVLILPMRNGNLF